MPKIKIYIAEMDQYVDERKLLATLPRKKKKELKKKIAREIVEILKNWLPR